MNRRSRAKQGCRRSRQRVYKIVKDAEGVSHLRVVKNRFGTVVTVGVKRPPMNLDPKRKKRREEYWAEVDKCNKEQNEKRAERNAKRRASGA